MSFPTLGISDHLVVSVSIDLLSYSQSDAQFHCIGSDYSHADWNGLHDHLGHIPWEHILRISASAVLLVNFVSGFRLELMHVSLITSIRSNLTRLHGFQLLVLLPEIEIYRAHF